MVAGVFSAPRRILLNSNKQHGDSSLQRPIGLIETVGKMLARVIYNRFSIIIEDRERHRSDSLVFVKIIQCLIP